jgi:hypothetical protein
MPSANAASVDITAPPPSAPDGAPEGVSARFAALGPVDGVDLRGLPDGSLWHRRSTDAAETAWTPRHVGRELQRIRVSASQADVTAIRSEAEAAIATQRGQAERAGRHAATGPRSGSSPLST